MRLDPFKLERYFGRYEFSVKHILCASDCESMSVADLLAIEPGSAEGLSGCWLGYTEAEGSPALREEISRIYAGIKPDQILVHSGAEEAIFLFMNAVLERGDHVIVHWPCYQSLFAVAEGIGCDVTLWKARPENGWALDPDELVRIVRPNTRAIVVNMPHNPTGYLMPEADFRTLDRIACERGIVLFSDEVYRGLEYRPADRLPSACEINPTSVSLGVMSKAYGLAGLRIGWIATRNDEIHSRMAAMKDYTTICANAPGEFLAAVAVRNGAALIDRNLRIIKTNLATLDAFFEAHAEFFAWSRPKAGPVAFPRLTGEDIEAFFDRLRTTAQVLLLPGTVYDYHGGHFRIGFGRKDLPVALKRLEKFLKGE